MILHIFGGGFGFYLDKHGFIAVFQFNVNFKKYVIYEKTVIVTVA